MPCGKACVVRGHAGERTYNDALRSIWQRAESSAAECAVRRCRQLHSHVERPLKGRSSTPSQVAEVAFESGPEAATAAAAQVHPTRPSTRCEAIKATARNSIQHANSSLSRWQWATTAAQPPFRPSRQRLQRAHTRHPQSDRPFTPLVAHSAISLVRPDTCGYARRARRLRSRPTMPLGKKYTASTNTSPSHSIQRSGWNNSGSSGRPLKPPLTPPSRLCR